MNLKSMIGKTYLYNAKEIVVTNIRETDDGLIEVHTNKRIFTFEKSQLKKELLPVETKDDTDKQLQVYYGLKNDSEEMSKLVSILMNNIEKVQNDKSYIDQASAINENARTIIEMQKVKVDMIKVLKS